MLSPVIYNKEAFKFLVEDFDLYWNDLPWENRGAPRKEAFVSKNAPVEYTYGSGNFYRTYSSSAIPDFMNKLWDAVEEFAGCKFELCFCNGYTGERDHLGWHADDSDSVDDNRPIVVVSIGEEREIMFRDREKTFTERLLLENGSGLIMSAGMQDTHDHRIPKAGRVCMPRISFTFRGLANG